MKVLYIGYDKKLVKSGADQIDIRNLELLYDSIPYSVFTTDYYSIFYR